MSEYIWSWGLRSWIISFTFMVVLSACSTHIKPSPDTSPQIPTLAASTPPLVALPQSGIKFTLGKNSLPTIGIWKSTPALADLNKDGHVDLVMLPRLGTGARVWFGDGRGEWREASEGLTISTSCGGGTAVADLNKDGHLDLAVADHCEGVFVYLGDGQGHWKAVTEKMNPTISRSGTVDENAENSFGGAESLAVGDVNEDGFLDLVVAASDEGGFSVYLGNGSGKKWRESPNPDGLPSFEDPEPGDQQKAGWAHRILLRDINGDNHLDVIASYYSGLRVWHGDGKGHWQSASQGLPSPMVGGIFWEVTVGDVNEDGRVDLAAGNVVNGVEVFLQNQDGSWQRTPDPMPQLRKGAMGVTLADFDSDGHLDLLVGGVRTEVEEGFGLFMIRGDGKGGWTEVPGTNLPEKELVFVWGTAVGDINGDGSLDLVIGAGGSKSGEMPIPLPGLQKKDVSSIASKHSSFPALQVWLNHSQKR